MVLPILNIVLLLVDRINHPSHNNHHSRKLVGGDTAVFQKYEIYFLPPFPLSYSVYRAVRLFPECVSSWSIRLKEHLISFANMLTCM